jgi:molybdopterin synthase catalytic subunit
MIELLSTSLSLDQCMAAVRNSGSGGIVSFVGTVRDLSEGKAVKFLDYEAYEPMAVEKLEQVVNEARQRWPINSIAIQHRVGRLAIGEDAVIIAVGCPHREEAFAACRYVIDRIKEIVPIWKKEYGENGAVWVGGPTAPESESSPALAPG